MNSYVRVGSTKKYDGGPTSLSYPDVVTVNATDADAEVVVYPRGEIVTNVVVCVFILLFTVLK